MEYDYYYIKDCCRKGLLKYLEYIFKILPEYKNPKILDIGCGTGIPTLWLAEHYTGLITAIDTDKSAIEFLQHKINISKSISNIKTQNVSFSDLTDELKSYDIILAEGFLNVVGFETGFIKVIEMLKPGGCFVIHDEYKDHEEKIKLIQKSYCEIIGNLFLDENIWWNDYYRQLETEINKQQNFHLRELFRNEIMEIDRFKEAPQLFRSVYYVVIKKQ
ncbi:MAG: class I SAM-dependent methyltransferase [Ignavibacteriaceae bacterium]